MPATVEVEQVEEVGEMKMEDTVPVVIESNVVGSAELYTQESLCEDNNVEGRCGGEGAGSAGVHACGGHRMSSEGL